METEIKELYTKYLSSKGVCTDTRKIGQGEIFFALTGESFNGNRFASMALERGAAFAVIDDPEFKRDERYILVPDALKALQDLAHFHRQQLTIPVLAITGSNGKTTTKELINAVLSKKYKTYATKGNLNNHIGIPLTLLSITQDIEIAVVEMGANHQKEIASYCTYTEPTHGIITNIGKAHLEGFGGIEGVKKGKGELYDYLFANNKTAFINSKNEILRSISKFENPVFYPGEKDFYHCEFIEASPFVKIKSEDGDIITTQIIGSYNFENIAAALCIGKYFNVPSKEANAAIAEYDPQNNRSQVVVKGSNKIILDAYNANPSSMKAAIENLQGMKEDFKIAILGDMLELGEESPEEHKQIGRLLQKSNFNKVIIVGKNMSNAKETFSDAHYFESKAALENWVKSNKPEKSTILIKGSRGMGLETVLELL